MFGRVSWGFYFMFEILSDLDFEEQINIIVSCNYVNRWQC